MYWGRLVGVLPYRGGSWRRLEASCRRLEAVLRVVGGVLKRLGAVLARSWGVLGASWGVLWPSWGHLGSILGRLGRVWATQNPPKRGPNIDPKKNLKNEDNLETFGSQKVWLSYGKTNNFINLMLT